MMERIEREAFTFGKGKIVISLYSAVHAGSGIKEQDLDGWFPERLPSQGEQLLSAF
jgi:hypothetical protein